MNRLQLPYPLIIEEGILNDVSGCMISHMAFESILFNSYEDLQDPDFIRRLKDVYAQMEDDLKTLA